MENRAFPLLMAREISCQLLLWMKICTHEILIDINLDSMSISNQGGMFYFGFFVTPNKFFMKKFISCTKLSETDTTDAVYTGFDASNDLNT